MKKWIIIAVILLVAYFSYAKHQFSEHSVEQWLVEHNMRVMQGGDNYCDDYADKVEASLTAYTPQGHWEVEGGKDELCGYLKKSLAALTVMQANTESQFSDIQVHRTGFPWVTAEVSYTEKSKLSANGMHTLYTTSHDKIVLKRTLGGLIITKLTSESKTGWSHMR